MKKKEFFRRQEKVKETYELVKYRLSNRIVDWILYWFQLTNLDYNIFNIEVISEEDENTLKLFEERLIFFLKNKSLVWGKKESIYAVKEAK